MTVNVNILLIPVKGYVKEKEREIPSGAPSTEFVIALGFGGLVLSVVVMVLRKNGINGI